MELQKTKREIKRTQWRELVLECRNSGMRIKDWCNERGISQQTYYRWQRQVWDAGLQQAELRCRPASQTSFVEYTPPQAPQCTVPAVILHLSCGEVEILNGAERETIENALSALQKLC